METSYPAKFAHDDDDKKDNNVKLQKLFVSVQYIPLTMVQDCMEYQVTALFKKPDCIMQFSTTDNGGTVIQHPAALNSRSN
jgi:hypothetical protein